MSNDTVQLMVEGTRYAGWKDIRVSRSIDTLCGKFAMTLVSQRIANMPEIVPGAAAIVMIGQDRIVNGYVDSMDVSMNATDTTISLAGRDRTSDLVDCSVLKSPGSWEKKTLYDMAKVLCEPFGVKVKFSSGFTDTAESFTLEIGDSPFDVLSRAAKERGVLLMTHMPSGDLWITPPGETKANDSLIYGKNIKSLDFSWEYANRFNKYVVKGQTTGAGSGWGQSTIFVKGEATDQNVRAARTKLIKADGQATSSFASKRAQFEAINRAAQSEDMNVVMVGYRQSNGELWRENMLADVSVSEGIIKVEGEYLISAIEYSIGSEGMLTKMTLRRKDAYKPEPTVKKSTTQGLVWR